MRPLGLMLTAYWTLFWFTNGVDKFVNRTDLFFFTWHGKDRSDQFSGYFSKINISVDWVAPILTFTGLVEILIAAVLFYGLCQSKKTWLWIQVGSILGGAVFIAFSVFDVIAGDRAELLEHSTYLVLLAITLFILDQNKSLMKDSSFEKA